MASGATIANAYVQVIPSMSGVKASLESGMGGASASAGESSGSIFGGKFGGAIKKYLGAAAIGKTITDTVIQGAKLQQSLGGVETLFKKSAGRVEANARQAFKTTGMSANDYMENVTSFSASLISSMGGNTQKAAKWADVAMRDMSDNANKMGTDLESITETYQSIARGNYAMLDNLKLGYGGTKSEMERLMADAEKLTGKHYTVGDFGDTVKAIHVIQENLDITGTTAKEAAGTISGSFNMVKAAAKDLMGNLALGNDVAPYLQNLGSSALTFAKNLIPAVVDVIVGIPKAIYEHWPEILAGIQNLFNQAQQAIIANGPSFWANLPSFLGKAAVVIINSLDGILSQLLPVIIRGVAKLIAAAFRAFLSASGAFWSGVMAKAKTSMGNVIAGVQVTVASKISSIVSTFASGWAAVRSKTAAAFNRIKAAITKPIESAKQTVSNIIGRIKGLFPIRIGHLFKGLQLPHFSISTGSKKFGKLGTITYPTGVGVSWHANGGIFTRPTLLGGNNGVGEAGAEAVLPLSTLWSQLDNLADNIVNGVAIASQSGAGSGGPQIINVTLYADKGGAKLGEWVVNTYDTYKRRLG